MPRVLVICLASIAALIAILVAILAPGGPAQAQVPAPEYIPQSAISAGAAPGLAASELKPNARTFHITFAKGDDVRAGLAEFARKNHLTDAYFMAIGALGSAVIGQSDHERGAFRAVRLNEEMEVTSLSGNIVLGQGGNPVVHAHCVVALLRNGAVYAGHLLQGRVSLTLQMYLVDSQPLAPAQSPVK
jgi:predicted DNA-binding protein with PD1-like motif